jgi:hypothetical protein
MVLLALAAVAAISVALYAVLFGLLVIWADHDLGVGMILVSFGTCGVAVVCFMAIRRLAVGNADRTSQTAART